MKEFAPDIKLLLYIHENEKKHRPVWHTRATEETGLSKKDVSIAEDKLYDLGLTNPSWDKAEGYWVYCYHLGPEARYLAETLEGSK